MTARGIYIIVHIINSCIRENTCLFMKFIKFFLNLFIYLNILMFPYQRIRKTIVCIVVNMYERKSEGNAIRV